VSEIEAIVMPAALSQAAQAALAGVRDAHGGATRCPQCGYRGHSALAELELEINPGGTVLPEMLMEHLGHAAAEAATEAEAEAFIGALIPLAARVIPQAAPTIMRVAPQLIRGASRITRALRRDPATRHLVRALPTVMRDTAATVARRAARGQETTPQGAVRILAGHAHQSLTNRPGRRRAGRRSLRLDHQYHQAACPRTYEGGAPDPLLDRRPLLVTDVDEDVWTGRSYTR
jgi:hypothetical protein